MNTLKDGVCQSCGRDYSKDGDLEELDGKCPADDCPSKWEEQGVAHPDFPAELHHRKFKMTLHTAEDEQAARVEMSKRTY
jgi:hypothetical protein